MERYARQVMIEGWDQKRLAATTMLVIGSGLLARLSSLLAAAMGIGRIFLLGDGRVEGVDRRFLLTDVRVGSSLVRTWAEALRRVNPEIVVEFSHDVPCSRSADYLRVPHVIVEASQDLGWKGEALAMARHWQTDLITAASGPRVGLYRVGPTVGNGFACFRGVREDPLVSLVVAALLVEEVRRLRLPLGPSDLPPEGPVLVSPEALHRYAGGTVLETGWGRGTDTTDITLVGAGALGTWVGIALGMSTEESVRLRVYDPDLVEATNLNRQVLFWDSVHKPKATALSERLTALFPAIEARGHVEAVDDGNLAAACTTDLVVCGPDTFAARALLHRGSLLHRTSLVNGGTSAFGASVAAYVPGRSPCLECSMRVATMARALSASEERARCAGTPEPSVVTSSALAGALMAYEARASLAGRPIRGVVEYDGLSCQRRLGARPPRTPCGCGGARLMETGSVHASEQATVKTL
ncbi:MAG: ThiF family adenylyltransferase [Candidatus Latescibacteria bacterium]|jgi:molybdopterin/thiamine biosynthesis adenylyltransferase|nr:ThiF family adenylyltransferase [Candidatus Latescibacterota bacterium]